MVETRHRTVVEFDIDARKAEAVLGRLERAAERARAHIDRAGGGGGGGYGPGGGGPGGGGPMGSSAWSALNKTLAPNDGPSSRFKAGSFGAAAGMAGMGVIGAGASIAGAGPASGFMAAGSVLMGAAGGAGRLLRGYEGGGISGGVVRGAGRAISASVPFIGAAFGIGAAGLSMRYQIAQQKANAQYQMSMARMFGARHGLGAGVSQGFSPTEAASLSEQFGQQAGFSGAFGGMGTYQYQISKDRAAAEARSKFFEKYGPLTDAAAINYKEREKMEQDARAGDRTRTAQYSIFDLARSGVPLSSLAQYRGLLAPGAGGTGQTNLGGMAAQIQGQGLLGGRAAEYLQTIASATNQMASQGLSLDLGSTEQFIARMQGTSGTAGTGLYQARAIGALGGARSGARQQLLGGFQGVGQAAMLAQAMGAGGGIRGALGALEGMDSPQAMLDAVRGQVGNEGASLFLASQGLTSDFAYSMGGGLGQAAAAPRLKTTGGGLKAAFAAEESKMFGTVSNGQARQLIKDVGTIREVVSKAGSIAQKLSEKITDLIELIQ